MTNSNNLKIPASQIVTKISKHLYKNIDGAFKFTKSSNMCDIYFTLLYQIPYWERIPGKGSDYNDMHEMTINLNITTYNNSIRVNVIEVTPEERTLGYDLYKPEALQDLDKAQTRILNKVILRVSKAYKDYDFIF